MPEFLSLSFIEILIILFLAFLLLKPSEYQALGKWVGKTLREIVTSDGWKTFQQTSRDFRTLPNRLMRQANDELNGIKDDIKTSDLSKNDFREALSRLRRDLPPKPKSTTHSDSQDQSQDPTQKDLSHEDEQGKNA